MTLLVGDRVRYSQDFLRYLGYLGQHHSSEEQEGTVVSLEGNRQADLVMVRWDPFPDSRSLHMVGNLTKIVSQGS